MFSSPSQITFALFVLAGGATVYCAQVRIGADARLLVMERVRRRIL